MLMFLHAFMPQLWEQMHEAHCPPYCHHRGEDY